VTDEEPVGERANDRHNSEVYSGWKNCAYRQPQPSAFDRNVAPASASRLARPQSGAPPPWPWTGPGLRQLRLPCVPKRQVGNAFCHFASITVCLPAFFPNSVDLVVVAAQIKGCVDNREEKSREYRDADRPHARLPPKIRR
jgi:hypothetical protein